LAETRTRLGLGQLSPGAVDESLTPRRSLDSFLAVFYDLLDDGAGRLGEVPAKMIHNVINLPVLPRNCAAIFVTPIKVFGHPIVAILPLMRDHNFGDFPLKWELDSVVSDWPFSRTRKAI
jgi:hypothetical protein